MPDWCLKMRCIDCESHAIISGKLDCNYMNRLGLAQPTVKSFLQDTPPEKSVDELDAELKQMEEQAKLIEQKKKEIEEKKKQAGGVISAGLS